MLILSCVADPFFFFFVSRVSFLFEYELALSSILFIIFAVIVLYLERRAALKKIQVDELSPLLLDDGKRYSSQRSTEFRY